MTCRPGVKLARLIANLPVRMDFIDAAMEKLLMEFHVAPIVTDRFSRYKPLS